MCSSDLPAEGVQRMVRSVLGRDASAGTLARLDRLHADALARYRQSPADAKNAGGSAEDAAMALVAITVLNLDDAMVK